VSSFAVLGPIWISKYDINAINQNKSAIPYLIFREQKNQAGFYPYWNFPVLLRIRYKSVMNSDRNVKRLHVIFSGRVQGVGFRYTTAKIASHYAISGSVKNLWDGNVELIAEGKESELVDFLNHIHGSRLERNIVKERLKWEPPSGAFNRFGIEL
jgi:acylphosphatase